jgi:hypothetical protein
MKANSEVKIAFFDAKPYDIESFKTQNQSFGFDITYFPSHLTETTCPSARATTQSAPLLTTTSLRTSLIISSITGSN